MRKQIATLQRIEGELDQVLKELKKDVKLGPSDLLHFYTEPLKQANIRINTVWKALEIREKGGK